MTLTNLLAIRRLQAFEATAQGTQRLLAAAERNLVLPLTMALPNDVIIVLDALRKQRNQNDHEGDPVGQAVVTECISQARSLLAHTRQLLQSGFPALLK